MKKKICENCSRWWGKDTYLAARSYSAECGGTDPNYSCKHFVLKKNLKMKGFSSGTIVERVNP